MEVIALHTKYDEHGEGEQKYLDATIVGVISTWPHGHGTRCFGFFIQSLWSIVKS
jgi:hypothetical protein